MRLTARSLNNILKKQKLTSRVIESNDGYFYMENGNNELGKSIQVSRINDLNLEQWLRLAKECQA